ncbi:pseudouridine synthase [Companilactobacillus sp. RD055328]|uniref:RluA family pseudouridine synthase n=1 Tax=Companilactobacillus sp. RD055328 TaxID=2916634 RepID=UPI001FC7CF4F|nr:RluA family pseudouridine synthase [Companilactobacillus sp. RD055328]GKQ42696.1 pseudouridine synthase [Companilactobacillus sp. RD055328]
MTNKIQLTVETDFNNTRLDKYLTEKLDSSRSQIKLLINDGAVSIDDSIIKKTGYKLKSNSNITIDIPTEQPLTAEPEKMDLDIIYEDDDVLVVNKPQGMVVHPSAGHPNHTLVNGLMYHTTLAPEDSTLRPGIVHRIDKDTSGLLMVAKNENARESLMKQLKDKTNTREYLAIVHGTFSQSGGKINAPIGRSHKDRKKQAVIPEGRNAVTHFKVLEQFAEYSYLSLNLETGRTHQIRVHLKYIDHPVAGDPLYGPKKTLKGSGQFLHAYKLGFKHPRTGEQMEFSVEPPAVFKDTLSKLKLTVRQ